MRSLRPSAQRYSIATVRPSIQPSSPNRPTKAVVQWCQFEGVLTPRNPMVGSFPGCCPAAASGHTTAAPPKSVMNLRRFMSDPKLRRRHLSGSNEYFDRGRNWYQNHCRSAQPMSLMGHSLRIYSAPAPTVVRCCSDSDQRAGISKSTRCARSCHMHCSKMYLYSITSSARASSCG